MPQPSANMSRESETGESPLRPGLLRSGLWIAAIGLGGVVWSLHGTWIDRTSPDAPLHNAAMLWPFWIASAVCWIGLTMVWIALRRGDSHPKSRSAIWIVLGVAVLARGIVLTTHDPALSDDVYRYIFDGRNLANGLNPYLTDPDDRSAALASGTAENWRGERKILALLAYPEITTPYLPVSQHVFALMGAACERAGWTTPRDSARAFRAGFVAIEIAMMLLVLAVLRKQGYSPWWLTLYAWHPLAIDGFAASGHQDIIGIAFMVAALALLPSPSGRGVGGEGVRKPEHAPVDKHEQPSPQPSPKGRGSLSTVVVAVLLAMSIMVKPIAALAGLFMLRRLSWRDRILAIIVGASVCCALALPLRWYPKTQQYIAWKQTADWMAEKAAHFGGVYEPILCIVRHAMPDGPDRVPGFNLEQEWLARRICMGVLAVSLLAIFIFVRDQWRATASAMFFLVLCSTTCHPWYLLWGLALMPLARGGLGMWTYSLTISWGYAVFIGGKGHAFGVEWTVAPWALAIAYIPVLVAVIMDIRAMLIRACAKPQAATAIL